MRSKFGGENQENQASAAAARSLNGLAPVDQAVPTKVGGKQVSAKVPAARLPVVEVEDEQNSKSDEADVALVTAADGQNLAVAAVDASLETGLDGDVSVAPLDRAGSPVGSSLGLGDDSDATLPLIIGGGLLLGGLGAVALGGGGNAVPVFSSGATASVAENSAASTVVYDANATDADTKDTLTYSLSGADAGSLSINSATGAVTLNAAANFETKSSYAFTVNVSDGTESVAQSVTLTITNVNEAPVISSGATGTVAENAAVSTVVYDANATDVDAGAALVYSLSGADAAAFNINSATGEVRLNASANFEVKPSYAITVTATDNGTPVLAATQAVVVSVTNVNEVPVITSGATGTVAENAAASTVVYDANATDVDGNALVYSLSGADAAAFSINGTTGEVRLNAPANFERQTSYAITVTATDNGTPVLAATQPVTVSVTNQIDVVSVDGLGATQAPVTVNVGILPGDATDSNFQISDSSGVQTEVNVTNFGANDFVFFEGLDPNDYTYQNDGNGNLVITRLDDDGFTTNVITLVGTTGGLIDPGALVFNEATAEAALADLLGPGDYLRGSADPLQAAIVGTTTFNAAGAQVTFTEDLDAPESSIVINNFRSDDVIVFIDGDIGEVSFGTDPGDAKDLRIEYFDFGTNQASTIILNDVLDPAGPAIFDQASAEAALGIQLGAGDYFQVG